MHASPSAWRDKDLLSSNTENLDTHISGFPARANLHFKPFNQALCMASQPPQNFPSKISGQGTQSYLWWYASPWGNFIKLPRFLRRRTRWVATAQLEGQILFSARGEGAAPLILRKRQQQRKPLQIPAPPIGPPLALHQSGSCLQHQPFPN